MSELLALPWQDIDFSNHIGELKTAVSAAVVPASQEVTDTLARCRQCTLYAEPTDWVFPSPKMGGKQPYWQDSLMRKVIWPAANRAGITKRIGWHTFRRSLATLLIDVGTLVKLTQEIMRHANSRVTLELYQQVSMTAKQELQARVVSVW